MTRINVVHPHQLTDQHLLAEIREIVRMPSYLNKSLNSKKGFKMSDIPLEYTMGKGHVKFFYNKFGWLRVRFLSLLQECTNRGFNITNKDDTIFKNVESKFIGIYIPTEDAYKVNRERIIERIRSNRDFYTYCGKKRKYIIGDKVTYRKGDGHWTNSLNDGNYIINRPYMDGYSLLNTDLSVTGYWARESTLEHQRIRDTRLARKMYPDYVENNGWLYEI